MKQEEVIQALKDGAILGVDWREIDEMLGLTPKHPLHCTLYANTGNFIPTPMKEFDATEKKVSEIVHKADINWMSDDYLPEKMFIGHIMTRFFAVKEPNRVRWMQPQN